MVGCIMLSVVYAKGFVFLYCYAKCRGTYLSESLNIKFHLSNVSCLAAEGSLAMDKLKLTGRNLRRVCNSKLGHAFVYTMPLHT